MGWGRGWGWGPPPWAYGPMGYEPYGHPYPYRPTEEDLKEEVEILKEEKADIETRLAEIEKGFKEKKGGK
jgi:hypothetical protein